MEPTSGDDGNTQGGERMTQTLCEPVTWHGCYNDSWRDVIVPEAFAHPAKFAPGLIRRIYTHGLERGYWRKGDMIGDPFGGIAGGGVIGAYLGLRWLGVELEAKFVALGRKNIALHRRKWEVVGDPEPVLVQGDSREFASIVRGHLDAVVTSPPYGTMDGHTSLGHPELHQDGHGILNHTTTGSKPGDEKYGDTPGQIGALKSGDLDAVVTSPPYGDRTAIQDQNFYEKKCVQTGRNPTSAHAQGINTYGSTPGQIGALKSGDLDAVVTSPPWATAQEGGGIRKDGVVMQRDGRIDKLGNDGYQAEKHGSTPGQIGVLKSGSIQNPQSEIENEPDTYWTAMHAVYTQCILALKPGGVMAVVIKDYVKAGERVPLCDQTLALLVSLGFEPIERVRAMLVTETVEAGLFGEIVTHKERKSFFRRLAEKKGSPRIDWEEVLFVRKA